ncbi:MAG TPA: hypothetical protein VJM06_01570 [Gaiellaceae bacterium]|nr:hypothetical protein [Gaiellaceae bacterium]
MAQRRDLAEKLRHDVLTGDEQLDRLDARRGGSLDEVLALDGEEPGLVPLLPRREKLPDEPELLVLTGFDEASAQVITRREADAGRCEGRTQGASISADMDATEDAASRLPGPHLDLSDHLGRGP